MKIRTMAVIPAVAAIPVAFSMQVFADPVASLPHECQLRHEASGTHGQVVICPSGLDMNAWRDVGMGACESLEQCNAFIWDDASMAPERPPREGEKMSPEQAAALVAIWYNDTQRMVLVRRTEQE